MQAPKSRALRLLTVAAIFSLPWISSCSDDSGTPTPMGVGGTAPAGTGGTPAITGGTTTATTGGTTATTGGTTATTGGTTATTGGTTATTGGTTATTGGTTATTGGTTATGGSTTTGGGGATSMGGGGATSMGGNMGNAGTSFGGSSSAGGPTEPLDCGANGIVVENAGPPSNRVNYAIVGDGYSASELDTTYPEHLATYMEKRFSDVIGQPYGRYRRFVNICAVKVTSSPICGSSALGCCGDNSSRLANCNSSAANSAISSNLPSSFEVDWKAVVLNGSSWWNTGSSLMLWSGGNQDAAGAALHEGGHGFHQLADEYCAGGTGVSCGPNGGGPNGQDYNEINSTGNGTDSGGKWNVWLEWDQAGATGVQGLWRGSRYVDSGQYRPSGNSMMNSLFGSNTNTSFNATSREKMVFDIWRVCTPIDSTDPPAGAVSSPATLTVNVIDPTVINVDWSVDGNVVAANGGPTFDVASAGLAAGSHEISARAYDNAGEDLVRYRDGGSSYGRMNWSRSQQTVTWTVTTP